MFSGLRCMRMNGEIHFIVDDLRSDEARVGQCQVCWHIHSAAA
jgi:hypothetical protein